MIIQALNDDHASAFQALRLFGLRESPASFGSSYEEEHSRTDQQIVTHLVGSPERKFLGASMTLNWWESWVSAVSSRSRNVTSRSFGVCT